MKTATTLLLGLLVLATVAYCHSEEMADNVKSSYLARKRRDDDDQETKGRKMAGEKERPLPPLEEEHRRAGCVGAPFASCAPRTTKSRYHHVDREDPRENIVGFPAPINRRKEPFLWVHPLKQVSRGLGSTVRPG
ncbi:hypothetical protein MRX96_023419 [Rhipicephalus microplus]